MGEAAEAVESGAVTLTLTPAETMGVGALAGAVDNGAATEAVRV